MLERDLFIAALDIDDATGRKAYLDAVCLNNAALRNRLERLLSHAREDSDFLDQPAADLCSDWDSDWLAELNGITQSEGEPVTQTGAAGDTGQTVLLNAAVPAESASTTEVLTPSQLGTLFGRYRIERILGQGGMGIVYLAQDLRLGRHVALKIPKFDVDGKLHLVERFRREARTMGLVQHRHLCPIFDVAPLPHIHVCSEISATPVANRSGRVRGDGSPGRRPAYCHSQRHGRSDLTRRETSDGCAGRRIARR